MEGVLWNFMFLMTRACSLIMQYCMHACRPARKVGFIYQQTNNFHVTRSSLLTIEQICRILYIDEKTSDRTSAVTCCYKNYKKLQQKLIFSIIRYCEKWIVSGGYNYLLIYTRRDNIDLKSRYCQLQTIKQPQL